MGKDKLMPHMIDMDARSLGLQSLAGAVAKDSGIRNYPPSDRRCIRPEIRRALRPYPILLSPVPLLRLLQHYPPDAPADGWLCQSDFAHEADFWIARAGERKPAIRTIFFGGGTPSLLPIDSMRRLIESLAQRFDFSNLEEWTVEINPATAELDYCRMLRDSGVDRVSFGAQSFNSAELKILERHHNPEDVGRSVEIARQAGFSRINVDLIYAIPGQDLASWDASLDAALAMKTPHVSCYNLTYEPNTPMAVRKRLGQFTPVEESVELEMFHHARRRLTDSGLEAYEISNYAGPNEACRHNLVYWTGGNYIGLGPSAASRCRRSADGRIDRISANGNKPCRRARRRPSNSKRSRPPGAPVNWRC